MDDRGEEERERDAEKGKPRRRGGGREGLTKTWAKGFLGRLKLLFFHNMGFRPGKPIASNLWILAIASFLLPCQVTLQSPQPFGQSVFAHGAEPIVLLLRDDLHAVRLAFRYRIDFHGTDDV